VAAGRHCFLAFHNQRSFNRLTSDRLARASKFLAEDNKALPRKSDYFAADKPFDVPLRGGAFNCILPVEWVLRQNLSPWRSIKRW